MAFKAIDLFCGAGGLSSGLQMSGFEITIGVDFDRNALETYKMNFKKTNILNNDIRYITGNELLGLAKIERKDNFLLAGCPPCQGFSNLGNRDKDDIKNQLVFEYTRIIDETQPSFILMENVPGMSRGIGKEIFAKVVQQLQKNYHIEYKNMNAADFGVPQLRKRLVLQGVRNDVYELLLKINKCSEISTLPKPTHSNNNDSPLKKWETVKDAIYDLPNIEAGGKYDSVKVFNHVARNLSETNLKRLDFIRKNGGSRNCLNSELALECHKKDNVSYSDTYGVLDLEKPAPTITSGCTTISKGRFGHPFQNRGLSIREAARLQSFGDDFIFSGNMGSMSLQVGNAVPPKLANASGNELIKYMEIYQDYLDASN